MEWKFEYKIFLILIILSLAIYFIFNDKYEDPKTTVNAQTNETTYSCEGDYYLKQNQTTGNYTCYNPTPFGHTVVTTPQLFSIFMTIGVGFALILQKKREFYSNKIIPLENRYKPDDYVITKSPDVYSEKGYIWMRSGFDDVVSSTGNEIYISKKELVYQIAGSYILWGKLLKINVDALYLYLNKDFRLLQWVLKDYQIKSTSKGIDNYKTNVSIFIPIPLRDDKVTSFLSIKGNYGFHADRFKQTILNLLKSRDGLDTSYSKGVAASKRILEDSTYVAQTTSTIAEAHGVTRRADIVSETAYKPPEQRDRRYEEQR